MTNSFVKPVYLVLESLYFFLFRVANSVVLTSVYLQASKTSGRGETTLNCMTSVSQGNVSTMFPDSSDMESLPIAPWIEDVNILRAVSWALCGGRSSEGLIRWEAVATFTMSSCLSLSSYASSNRLA